MIVNTRPHECDWRNDWERMGRLLHAAERRADKLRTALSLRDEALKVARVALGKLSELERNPNAWASTALSEIDRLLSPEPGGEEKG
jgi:hypothetical protein